MASLAKTKGDQNFKNSFQIRLNLSNQMTPACIIIVSPSFEKLVNQFLKTIQTFSEICLEYSLCIILFHRLDDFIFGSPPVGDEFYRDRQI